MAERIGLAHAAWLAHLFNQFLKKAVPDKKNYIIIEDKILQLAEKFGMKAGEFDLYLWCLETGKVLK